MPYIPKNLKEVTPDWVSSHFPGKALENIEYETIGEGSGMMSVMAVLHLDWHEAEGMPASLVIKLATDNEQNLEVARQFKPFLKEVNYYRELVDKTPAKSPKIYGAEIDANHNFYLLMEDASSYRMGDHAPYLAGGHRPGANAEKGCGGRLGTGGLGPDPGSAAQIP